MKVKFLKSKVLFLALCSTVVLSAISVSNANTIQDSEYYKVMTGKRDAFPNGDYKAEITPMTEEEVEFWQNAYKFREYIKTPMEIDRLLDYKNKVDVEKLVKENNLSEDDKEYLLKYNKAIDDIEKSDYNPEIFLMNLVNKSNKFDLSDLKFWEYGNWCGPGHSGPARPKDILDTKCMFHDKCYGFLGYFNDLCDIKFVNDLENIVSRYHDDRYIRIAIKLFKAKTSGNNDTEFVPEIDYNGNRKWKLIRYGEVLYPNYNGKWIYVSELPDRRWVKLGIDGYLWERKEKK